jgi:hypothetical protein
MSTKGDSAQAEQTTSDIPQVVSQECWHVTAVAAALVLLVSVGADPALAITTGRGYQWINGKSGLCIGISADCSAKGVPIVQYGRNLHTDQGWDAFGLPIYPDSAHPVTSVNKADLFVNFGANNRRLGTLCGKTENGTKIVSKACNTANTDELRRPVSAYYYGYPAG